MEFCCGAAQHEKREFLVAATIVLTSGLVEHDLPGAAVRHLLVGRTAGQGLGLVRVALVHTVSGVDLHNK